MGGVVGSERGQMKEDKGQMKEDNKSRFLGEKKDG